jgi:hypothetical protein
VRVHIEVRDAQEIVGRDPVLGRRGDADFEGESFGAGRNHRFGDGPVQPVAYGVAADTAAAIGQAHLLGHHASEDTEGLVAGFMSPEIVVALELVDVDHEEREGRVRRAARQMIVEQIFDFAPVVEPGEHVGLGEVEQLMIGFLEQPLTGSHAGRTAPDQKLERFVQRVGDGGIAGVRGKDHGRGDQGGAVSGRPEEMVS